VELTGVSLPAFDAILDLEHAQGEIVCRLSVPASRQGDWLSALPALDDLSVLADLGSGLVYLKCRAHDDALTCLRSLALCPVFLAVPEGMKQGLDVFGGCADNEAALLRRLKAEYDPTGIFNRGRFVLGI
jgi:hypothetical protein